ncbi:MAG: alpha/beta hydrolase [Chloroflexi bacterium]|nr:alpha/beta hydrolase [Chloroflexota bacterium]
MNTIQSDSTVIDGQRIHYYAAGQAGSPVVLLHGGGLDSAMMSWGEIIAPLSAQHRVIAPDLPGYGHSDKPDITYSMDFYIHFLEHFLTAMHLDRVSLAGLSLGGGIALGFTLNRQEHVEKLVLVDAYGIQSQVAYHKLSYLYARTPLNEFSYWLLRRSRSLVRQSLLAIVDDPRNITAELLGEVCQALQDPCVGRAFMSLQRDELRWNSLRSDYTSRLAEIRVPTLILHGDHDVTVPVACAERAHALIPHSELVLLKNRKHWALRDRPEEAVDLLLKFFEDTGL